MRLFTGLDLPAAVVRKLEELLGQLRPTARISWSPPANLHVTTRFIGEWPEERLKELCGALSGIRSRQPLPVRIRGLGFYPNARAPRIFWCGIEAPGLPELAAETDAATAALGIPKEDRAYNPHLTLARIKDRGDPGLLQQKIASLASTEFGEFEARSFFLYRSTLKPTGSVYTKLAEFPLLKQ
jgi:RNA 2',3'-cyclic 3'-phosphodiesterase